MGILRYNKRNFILVFILINIYAVGHFPDEKTLKEYQLKTKSKEWINRYNEKGYLENKGQMMDIEGKPAPFVLFKTEMPNANLWITKYGITLQTLKIEEDEKKEREKRKDIPDIEEEKIKVYWERMDIELKGANIQKENIIKEEPMQGYFNFFYPHCSDGIYGVKEYRKIIIKNVYPNIDWVWYQDKEKGYKYDFVVHPGGDYKQIHLLYKSKRPVKINENGELEIRTDYGNFKELRPVSFYDRKAIDAKFEIKEQRKINIDGDNGYESIVVLSISQIQDRKDLDVDLIIDPQLYWATFYGGSASYDGPMSADTDGNGNLFVTGYVYSTDFPVQNAGTFFQGALASVSNSDVFILKFDNLGNRLWATYYGGSVGDYGFSITADGSGNVFVTGYTTSTNFPVQNAGTFFQGTLGGLNDVFILKFDNSGNRLWATYYGGSIDDYGFSVTTDGSGNVFITGFTLSTDFPLQNAGTFYQGTNGGVYDAFVMKFDNLGNRLWATYYGGNSADYSNSIITDGSGNVFVTGYTTSTNFPVQNAGTFFQGTYGGSWDAFILKFDNLGNRLWATYYGGSGSENQNAYDNLSVDNCGNLYVSLETSSNPFPYLQNSCDTQYYDDTFNGGASDILLSLFSNTGSLLWCTYMGGNGLDFRESLAIDPNNNLFIVGEWTEQGGIIINSAAYPVINPGGTAYYDPIFNGGTDDGYIVKFLSAPCLCNNVLSISVTTQNSSCYNQCVGSATAIPSGGTPPYTYLWLPIGQTSSVVTSLCAGTYTLIIADAASNTNSTTFNITQPPPLTPSITANNPLCSGQTLTLTATPNGMVSYNWTGPNGFSSTLQNPTINNVFASNAGIYTLSVNDGTCTGTTTLNVVIYNPPKPSITANNSLCSGDTLSLTGIPNGMASYNWTGPNGFSSSYQNNIITNVSTAASGIYTLVVTDNNGCQGDTTLFVNVYPLPIITLSLYNDSCNIGKGQITANVINGTPPYQYQWNTGNTTHQIINLHQGWYIITVTDFNNCTQTDSIQITNWNADCEPFIEIPNVFTPNEDGVNDYFFVKGRNIIEIQCIILDRWGIEMFNDVAQRNYIQWNGKNKSGGDVPTGTYFYIINYKGLDSKIHQKKGYITLLR